MLISRKQVKVLLVDFDSQANMSRGWYKQRKPTVYELIAELATARRNKQTKVENLEAIPASIDLAGAAIELVDQDDRDYYLKMQ